MELAQTGTVSLLASGLLHGWTWPHMKKGLVDLSYLTPATSRDHASLQSIAVSEPELSSS